MKQQALTGTIISDPKVLKMSPILLFVKIADARSGQLINCLVHKHGLNFLYQATLGSQIAFYGHYNQRKQFVIDKFMINAQLSA